MPHYINEGNGLKKINLQKIDYDYEIPECGKTTTKIVNGYKEEVNRTKIIVDNFLGFLVGTGDACSIFLGFSKLNSSYKLIFYRFAG